MERVRWVGSEYRTRGVGAAHAAVGTARACFGAFAAAASAHEEDGAAAEAEEEDCDRDADDDADERRR